MSSTLFQAIKAGLEEIVVKFNAGLKAYKQATDDSIRQLTTKVDKCIQIADNADGSVLDPKYNAILPTGRVIETNNGLISIQGKYPVTWMKNDDFLQNHISYTDEVNQDEQVMVHLNNSMHHTHPHELKFSYTDTVITEVDGKPIDDVSIEGDTLFFTSSETRTLKLKTPIQWEGSELQLTIGKKPFSDLAKTFTGEVVADSGTVYDYSDVDDIVLYRVSFDFGEFNITGKHQPPAAVGGDPNSIRLIRVGLGLSDGSPIHHASNLEMGVHTYGTGNFDPSWNKYPEELPPEGIFVGNRDSVGYTANIAVPLQKVNEGVSLIIKSIRVGDLVHTFETPITIALPQPTVTKTEGQDFN